MTLPARKIPYQFLAMPALVLVAGCASTGGGGGGGGTPAFYSADVGTMQEALDSGLELQAHDEGMSTFIVTDWVADERSNGGFVEFSLQRNDDGTHTITIDGKSVTYTGDQLVEFGFESPGGDNNVYNHTASLDEFINGTGGPDYLSVWRYFWEHSDDAYYTGIAVVGTETKAERIGELANATYSGHGDFAVLSTADHEDWDRTNFWGELALSADFAAGSISGNMTNLEREDRVGGANQGENTIDGEITFEAGTVTGNGFAGGLAFSDFTDPDVFGNDMNTYDGEYAGKFYGPNAEELGGVTAVTGPGVVGNGGFVASKD